jgi:type I restriction enzyme M protein
MGALVDRTRRELSDEDIARIANTYHAWRGEKDAGAYTDVPGFCKAATLEEIRAHNHVLTPGRYVGAADAEDDDVSFAERFALMKQTLERQMDTSAALTAAIRRQLAHLA